MMKLRIAFYIDYIMAISFSMDDCVHTYMRKMQKRLERFTRDWKRFSTNVRCYKPKGTDHH